MTVKVEFPYIPTLLSFREADPIDKVFRQLKRRPDVLMVEGHGIAHPYGCGLASHVGVILKIPTIGVAKKLLCGEQAEYKGCQAPIYFCGKLVGAALITRLGCKPIYVSVGNMITIKQSIFVVYHCIRGQRMPEPLRLAHLLTRLP